MTPFRLLVITGLAFTSLHNRYPQKNSSPLINHSSRPPPQKFSYVLGLTLAVRSKNYTQS